MKDIFKQIDKLLQEAKDRQQSSINPIIKSNNRGQVSAYTRASQLIKNHRFANFANEECWIYQGDGSDHLESLTCPVVISASKLIELGG